MISPRLRQCGWTLLGLMLLAGCGGEAGEEALDDAQRLGQEVSQPSDPVVPDEDLFVALPAAGRVALSLQPHERARLDQTVGVEAVVPFPPDVLADAALVRVVTDDGRLVPAVSREVLTWHSPDGVTASSVRAVSVGFEWRFESLAPQQVWLEYGASGDTSDGIATPRHIAIEDSGFFPDEYASAGSIREPEVFVTLPPQWLGAALVRTRALPLADVNALEGFDDVQPDFGRTAVNDVGDHVTDDNLIDYQGEYEPWLFDRAGTLWNLYLRTGELKWFRHAWRATQFYRDQVKDTGYFALKSYDDLKYSYNQPLLTGFSLTGDSSLVAPVIRVATTAANDSFTPIYSSSLNFWTERHLAYSVQASLVAWEITGDFAYLDRANGIIAANLEETLSPDSGEGAIGCVLHTVLQHEGGGADSDQTACSPWMMGLYGEVLWRGFLLTGNRDALVQLSLFGDYLTTHGTYISQGANSTMDGRRFPYYLAGPSYDSLSHGVSDEWTDREHTCDVAALAWRSAYAKRLLGRDFSPVRDIATDLTETCLWMVPQWIRTSQATIDAGKTQYRLAPPRKFNWWFGPTSDMSWFMTQVP